ncbi:MAG TPA: HD domain-containing phosphohydrolase [Rectinemataceae bacterium]|nr:HD domain-containing phosphohydrolase [Rectinemataceae bacterium]
MKYRFTHGATADNLNLLLSTLERLHHIKDLHSLLDSILLESRSFTRADAGSIYLRSGSTLRFSYVQNDTLFRNDLLCNKYIYSNQEIVIDEKSLAGWVAKTGSPLVIDDVYDISKEEPYTFNRSFDEISTYRTKSMLIVPLKSSNEEVVGVIQLINAMDEEGKPIPFTEEMTLFIAQFAFHAAVAIERALTLRDQVLRIVKLSELRDPEETAAHVYRVSSCATEIYLSWAERHSVPRAESDKMKDMLRIASMLHDAGKVGIPDSILRKQAKLTEEEFAVIKQHAAFGAKLFENANSEWERLAWEIMLNHHEHWDGNGYPGKDGGIGKKGNEIPLSARIVAVADVYDALINKRVYKDAWEEEKVFHHLRQIAGKQLDPELVDIFFDIHDVIRAIQGKWQAEGSVLKS